MGSECIELFDGSCIRLAVSTIVNIFILMSFIIIGKKEQRIIHKCIKQFYFQLMVKIL
jgi:hypothetical protein